VHARAPRNVESLVRSPDADVRAQRNEESLVRNPDVDVRVLRNEESLVRNPDADVRALRNEESLVRNPDADVRVQRNEERVPRNEDVERAQRNVEDVERVQKSVAVSANLVAQRVPKISVSVERVLRNEDVSVSKFTSPFSLNCIIQLRAYKALIRFISP
jgi:hypothetical protein